MTHCSTGHDMHYSAAQFASIEMQALLAELEQAGVARELCARVAERYIYELGQKANKAQYDVFEIVTRIEAKLETDVASRLGVTNGMIADTNQALQRQGAAVEQLRYEFHATVERLSGIEAKVADHALDIASFKRSRQQSIDERRALQDAISDLREGRAANHNATLEVGAQVESLTQVVQQILDRITRDDGDEAGA